MLVFQSKTIDRQKGRQDENCIEVFAIVCSSLVPILVVCMSGPNVSSKCKLLFLPLQLLPAGSFGPLLPPSPFPERAAALVSHAQLPLSSPCVSPDRYQDQGATFLQFSMTQQLQLSSLNIALHFSRPMRLTQEVMIMILNKD